MAMFGGGGGPMLASSMQASMCRGPPPMAPQMCYAAAPMMKM